MHAVVAEPSLEVSSRLSIHVRGATGRGPTTLAAFDDALMAVGVANYNLLRLSSVIPSGSSVIAGLPPGVRDRNDVPKRQRPSGVVDLRSGQSRPQSRAEWGWRLYAVWAFEGAALLGQEAWAGIAWAQDPDDGRGLFVEHEGGSEAQVRQELEASLSSICRARGLEHLEQHHVIVGARCESEPVAALVIAPFYSEPWPAAPGSG